IACSAPPETSTSPLESRWPSESCSYEPYENCAPGLSRYMASCRPFSSRIDHIGERASAMKILPFRLRRLQPADVAVVPGRRMRRIGAAVLAAGVVSGALLYWIETRDAGPTMEELMPGYSRANSRLMGIYYGHAGQMMWEWRQGLAQPATQAAI